MPEFIIAWGAAAVGASLLAGLLAGAKNRDYSWWMAWCFVLPPLVFVLLVMPAYVGPRPRPPRLDADDNDRIF